MKKYFFLLIKISVAALAFYFLDKSGLFSWKVVQSIFSSSYSFLVLLLIFITLLFSTLRWYALLHSQKIKITFLECFKLYYIGYSINYLLPGGIAGDVIKIGSIVKNVKNKSVAGLSVIVDRILGLVACGMIILFFLPQIFLKINKSRFEFMEEIKFQSLYYSALIVLILLTCALLLFLINNKKIYKKIMNFLSRKKSKILGFLKQVVCGIFSYRKSKRILLVNIFLAAFVQLIMAFGLYFLGKNILPSNVIILDYAFSNIIAQIISVIPISPGGIGVGEAAFAKMLYYLRDRILLEYASIYLAFRALNIFFSLPGIMAFLFFKKKVIANKF